MLVICPECKKKLRLNAAVPAGKLIKCPNCATPFDPAVQAEKAPPAREESVTARRSSVPPKSARTAPDSADDDNDRPKKSPRRRQEEEEDDAPRASRKSKRRDSDDDEDDADDRPARRRKRAKKGSATLVWGSIGGGVGLIVLVAIGVVLAIVLRGGGSAQQEEAITEAIQIMKEFRATMESVKDQNSAKTAAPQINGLTDRMEALAKKAKALPKVSKAEDDRLKAKYKPQMDQLEQGMQQIGMQAGMNSRGEPSFMAALKKFGQVAQGMR